MYIGNGSGSRDESALITVSASKEHFLERLKGLDVSYHSKHPFHVRMHNGSLSKDELRRWIVNRFYYQRNIPIKDALILAKLPTREDRRRWIQRIIDHDGSNDHEGGIEAWLRLGEAAGIPRKNMLSDKDILPGVRFAVDAYVNFCRNEHWLMAVASSLTELFAPQLVARRIAVFEKHYQWIDPIGLDYFRHRLDQAPRDTEHALDLVLTHCNTPELQDKALSALQFKCEVLWSMLDSIDLGDSSKVKQSDA